MPLITQTTHQETAEMLKQADQKGAPNAPATQNLNHRRWEQDQNQADRLRQPRFLLAL